MTKRGRGSAAAATAFSAPVQKLMVPTIATAAILANGWAGFLPCCLPFFLLSRKMIRSEGPDEPWTHVAVKLAVFHLFFGGLLLGAAWVALLPLFGPGLTGWHALALYLPLYVIVLHDPAEQYNLFGTIVLRLFFDAPLIAGAYVCRELFGARLMSPFCTIFDEALVQGSVPLPSDIATLAAAPYNVGLIVNMCREYPGAAQEMARWGIEQCRLPHTDTTAPSYESVVRGCDRIRDFRKARPDRRVYVHCKGGIARASTMSLAHYVRNEGRVAAEAVEEMRRKRHVVMVGVQDYPAIRRLERERLEKEETKQG